MKKIILFSILFFSFAITFQNCSKHSLVLIEEEVKSIPSSIGLTASLCSGVSSLSMENNKFLVVLDMSTSNIGDWRTEDDKSYWDPSLGTDIHGVRFQSIENLISSCASSAGNKFAFIGFAKDAGRISYDSNKRAYLTCNNMEKISFKSKEEALRELEVFKNAWKSEEKYYSQWLNRPYNNYPWRWSDALRRTSYNSAIQCSRTVIYKDLQKSYEQQVSNYQVLFLSDGAPFYHPETAHPCASAGEPGSEARDECYNERVSLTLKNIFTDVKALRRRINLFVVGYGIDSDEDFKFLESLASSVQVGVSPRKIDSFEQDADVLCKFISSRLGVETYIDSLGIVVLSLRQEGGQYWSDSDMDGILDKDEVDLGYDPQHPRSGVPGVLDGVCEKIGGIEACRQVAQKVICDANSLSLDGFSDCDTKIIKQHWSHLSPENDSDYWNSTDWDKDSVPNFIEIVKGTDPFIDDMNRDPDNDGLNTMFEIMHSKNPFEHESLANPNLLPVVINHQDTKVTEKQCTGSGKNFLTLESMPPISSQATTKNGLRDSLQHEADEHIVAIFSSKKSRNHTLANKGISGSFIKLQKKVIKSEINKKNGRSEESDKNGDEKIILTPSMKILTEKELEDWGL